MSNSAIEIPGRVWDDFLNPLTSGMEKDLGLPRPTHRRRGRGFVVRYENVTANTARELAEYLRDRGETLLNQGVCDPYDPMEKAERDTYRAAIRSAERLLAA